MTEIIYPDGTRKVISDNVSDEVIKEVLGDHVTVMGWFPHDGGPHTLFIETDGEKRGLPLNRIASSIAAESVFGIAIATNYRASDEGLVDIDFKL